jgi:hypothetical protein
VHMLIYPATEQNFRVGRLLAAVELAAADIQ